MKPKSLRRTPQAFFILLSIEELPALAVQAILMHKHLKMNDGWR